MEKREFLVPEYYEDFHCKCGECRASCCSGWGITVDIQEYYRLLGAEVSEKTRIKLDCGMKVVETPTNDRYAKVGPGWDLKCPLQSEDGLCSLQTECGEGMIPKVCRIYPRTFRENYVPEACMSASCEKVVELLFAENEPLKFKKAEITCEKCENVPKRKGLTREKHDEIREKVFEFLKDRAYSFPERIRNMSLWLIKQDTHFEADSAVYEKSFRETPDAGETDLFRLAAGITAILGGRSQNLIDYLEEGFGNIGLPVTEEEPDDETLNAAAPLYMQAKADFEKRFPDWNEKFEKVFMNHVFFSDFPWTDLRENAVDECVALGVTYIVVKLLSVVYMISRPGEEDLGDVIAACFRVIEHTAFDRSACSALMIMEDRHSVNFSDVVLKI